MARAKIEDWAVQLVTRRLKREMGVLVEPKTSRIRPQKGFSWNALNACSIELVATTPTKERELEGSAAFEGPGARGKAYTRSLHAPRSCLLLPVRRVPTYGRLPYPLPSRTQRIVCYGPS